MSAPTTPTPATNGRPATTRPPTLRVETPSGRVVDLLDPDPATITSTTSRTRWRCGAGSLATSAGSGRLPTTLCCAASSSARPGDPEPALAALHHDSHQALIGDITAPVAQLLERGALRQVRRRLDEAIGTALGIHPDPFAHPAVVDADRAAVHLEARALQPRRGRALLTPPPRRRVAARPIISHGPRLAKRRFLAAHRRHTQAPQTRPGQPGPGHTIPQREEAPWATRCRPRCSSSSSSTPARRASPPARHRAVRAPPRPAPRPPDDIEALAFDEGAGLAQSDEVPSA
jgi:hypothetical protein